MSEEFDVFADAASARGDGPRPSTPGKTRKFRPYKKFARPAGPAGSAGSPIRGANGAESVNPLLNAPLPTEPAVSAAAETRFNRNPDLEEFHLADTQTRPAPAISP